MTPMLMSSIKTSLLRKMMVLGSTSNNRNRQLLRLSSNTSKIWRNKIKLTTKERNSSKMLLNRWKTIKTREKDKSNRKKLTLRIDTSRILIQRPKTWASKTLSIGIIWINCTKNIVDMHKTYKPSTKPRSEILRMSFRDTLKNLRTDTNSNSSLCIDNSTTKTKSILLIYRIWEIKWQDASKNTKMRSQESMKLTNRTWESLWLKPKNSEGPRILRSPTFTVAWKGKDQFTRVKLISLT